MKIVLIKMILAFDTNIERDFMKSNNSFKLGKCYCCCSHAHINKILD